MILLAFLIHHAWCRCPGGREAHLQQCGGQFARPFASFAVASGAVSKPGGDAAGQDALHSAGVEGSEDAGAHSKLPQPSQEEEALMCLLQHCVCVSRPCEILGDMNAEELKAVYPTRSTGVLSMEMGVCSLLCLLKSTTSSLVLSMLSERWFSWHHLVRVLTSSL